MSQDRDDDGHGPADERSGQGGIPGEQARQGTIILRSPLRRAIFIGGFVAIILLGLVLALT